MQEELEVESRCRPAGGAVAGGRPLDAPQPPPERQVAGLDGIEQEAGFGSSVLDEEERRIAFELGQAVRRLEPPDDRLEEVAGDGRRMLDLGARQVRGVARQVGDEEEPGLGDRGHVRRIDLGATPMSSPESWGSPQSVRSRPASVSPASAISISSFSRSTRTPSGSRSSSMNSFLASWTARISSSSFSWVAFDDRFALFWMTKTIQNVTTVVVVL